MGASATINQTERREGASKCMYVKLRSLTAGAVVGQLLWWPRKSTQLSGTRWQESTLRASVCRDNTADIRTRKHRCDGPSNIDSEVILGTDGYVVLGWQQSLKDRSYLYSIFAYKRVNESRQIKHER